MNAMTYEATVAHEQADARRAEIRATKAAVKRVEWERAARLNGAASAAPEVPVAQPQTGKPLTRAQKQKLARERKRAVQARTDALAQAAKSQRDETLAAAVQREPVTYLDPTTRKPVTREARVEESSWDDPADRNTATKAAWQARGFRRRDGLRDLKARRVITDAHWVAAEQFRDDLDAADGAVVKPEIVSTTMCSTPGYGPAMQQLEAQQRVRDGWQAVGLVLSGVFSWVVVSYGSIRDYETCKSVKHGRGSQLLVTALGRLADHYAGRSPRAQVVVVPVTERARVARVAKADAGPFVPWEAPRSTPEELAAALATLRELARRPSE